MNYYTCSHCKHQHQLNVCQCWLPLAKQYYGILIGTLYSFNLDYSEYIYFFPSDEKCLDNAGRVRCGNAALPRKAALPTVLAVRGAFTCLHKLSLKSPPCHYKVSTCRAVITRVIITRVTITRMIIGGSSFRNKYYKS